MPGNNPKDYTQQNRSNFYFISICLRNRYMGSRERSILVPYSSRRWPEDGGLKMLKHVASIIDVDNKEIELWKTEYYVILMYVCFRLLVR
jgi:hypothetical protein